MVPLVSGSQVCPPSRVRQILSEAGFSFEDPLGAPGQLGLPDSPEMALARRFLLAFARSNVITDEYVERRFRNDKKWVLETLVPVFETRDVLEEKTWRGKGTHRIWTMKYPLEMVLEAEEGGKGPLAQLWDDLRGLGTK